MREIVITNRFKKDVRLAERRGLDISKLYAVIEMLRKNTSLPEKYKDHVLVGKYYNHRECHIEPDWLLVYLVSDDNLVLTAVRTGSHADLF